METYIAKASLQMLAEIDAFTKEQGRFPAPNDLCKDRPTQRGAIIRHYATLERAALISRAVIEWSSGGITDAGARYLQEGTILMPIKGEQTQEELARVRLAPREKAALFHILRHYYLTGEFACPNDIIQVMHGRVTNRNRGHMNLVFRRLEEEGFIARAGSHHWGKGGRFTEAGFAIANTIPEPKKRADSYRRTGGGLAPDGGTRFPDMLFPATPGKIIQLGDAHSKLGIVVSRASGRRMQMGLPIATFSLEEGRTCSPDCGLRDKCYAGKMTMQRRIRYDGEATDRAIAKAICDREPHHYRLNTIGDFPNRSFLEAVLAAVTVSRSTAFGYTHWQPETELGAAIREYSNAYWDFFSIRTSYEHGSREPMARRAAVVLPSFDPELLRLHKAVPCPENLQRLNGVKFKKDVNCGNCGLCWSDVNVAFVLH